VTYLFAATLGVVQGLTEFLPVSSSAHLILARAFLGVDGEAAGLGLAFDVACHLGTLGAVLYYFRHDVGPLTVASPAGLMGGGGQRGHTVRLIAVGTVPIAILGLLAADWLETLREPRVVAVTLALGAIGMMVAERVHRGERTDADLTTMEALAIGCGQAAALVPGMSRSGTTLTVALLLGVNRVAAARFVFLMSIPAVCAAAGREALGLLEVGVPAGALGLFAVGLGVSAVVGYFTVKHLIRYLASRSLDAFAYYRFALAGVTAWLLVGP
jgi:undecaprenyl-diphosphatase